MRRYVSKPAKLNTYDSFFKYSSPYVFNRWISEDKICSIVARFTDSDLPYRNIPGDRQD